MSRNRIADLQLRGSTSPLPVRVYWPGQVASQPVPLLVFCTVGAGAGAEETGAEETGAEETGAEETGAEETGAEETCRGLSQDRGLLVLAVSCPAGAQDALTVLEWAAEHAAELGADPGRLLVAGHGAGGAVATEVAARARAAGWPEVALSAAER